MDAASITAAVGSLPRDVDPYAFILALFDGMLTPKLPSDKLAVVVCVTGGFAVISAICAIATVLAKMANGEAWIYQRRHTPSGALIVLNTALLYAGWGALYLSLAIATHVLSAASVDTLTTLSYFGDRRSPIAFLALVPCTWLSAIIALQTETYGIACIDALSRMHAGRRTLPPLALHATFLVLLIFCVVPPLAVFAVAIVELKRGLDAVAPIQAFLLAASGSWQPGEPFIFDLTLLPHVAVALDGVDQYAHFSRIGFGLLSTTTLLSCCALVPSAIGQIRFLRAQDLASRKPRKSRRGESTNRSITRSVRLLAGEVALVVLAGAVFSVISMWFAVDFLGIIQTPRKIQICFYLMLFTYSLTGTPIYILLATRAIGCALHARRAVAGQDRKIRLRLRQAGCSRLIGVHVEHEVAIAVDELPLYEPLEYLDASVLRQSASTIGLSDVPRSQVFVLPALAQSSDAFDKSQISL